MGPESHPGIEIFIQHVALQVPERAEYRAKASQAIVILMRELPGTSFQRVVRWLFCWAHNEKVAHRLFSVEVMGKILQEEERDDKVEIVHEEDEDLFADKDDEVNSNVSWIKKSLLISVNTVYYFRRRHQYYLNRAILYRTSSYLE
jgi:hypothetical protein